MQLLGCLFALFLGVFIIAAVFLGSVIDFVLSLLGLKKRSNSFGGFGHQNNANQQRQQQQQRNDSGQQRGQRPSAGQQTQKIFQKDESEYVDFEEI